MARAMHFYPDEMGRIRAAELAAAAFFLLAACGSKDEERQDVTQAVNAAGVSLALCGDVVRWSPPDAKTARDGELAVGDGSWRVAADARVTGSELLVPHTAVCVTALLDVDDRLVDCAVVARAPDPWSDAGY
ncbi:MAG TPA: hypothetical protein VIF62_03470 [Labilithrix sp.]